MRYKILLVGSYDVVVDEFFQSMGNSFECLSSSANVDDVMGHIRYFKPDAIVLCLLNETRQQVLDLATLKYKISSNPIPFMAIGDQETCQEVRAWAPKLVEIYLIRPLTASVIKERIIAYFLEKERIQREEEERRRLEEKRQQEAALIEKRKEQLKEKESERAQKRNEENFVSRNEIFGHKKEAGNKKHILVVDDDPLMLRTVKRYLGDDYEVATAISGKIARKFLEKRATDLILLDYEMPEETGSQALKKIRENPTWAKIPVIFLTGVDDAAKVREIILLKPQGYILKPIDRNKLLDTVATFLK